MTPEGIERQLKGVKRYYKALRVKQDLEINIIQKAELKGVQQWWKLNEAEWSSKDRVERNKIDIKGKYIQMKSRSRVAIERCTYYTKLLAFLINLDWNKNIELHFTAK